MADENQKRLLEFYGTECPHCHAMTPLVERVEKELGLTFEKFETWHNDDNEHLREQYDQGYCGGVPFFYNTASKKFICGSVSYEQLKAWADEN